MLKGKKKGSICEKETALKIFNMTADKHDITSIDFKNKGNF